MADSLNCEELIDESSVSARQKSSYILCCALAMVEGFDLQVMALVAPEIAEQWGIDKALFGLVFSAGLFAAMIGGFLVSIVGGRVGPKVSMELSTILLGLMTLGIIFAQNLTHLVILRFLAGIGLGAAIPGLLAIVSNYTPRRLRSLAVTVAAASQVLGAVVGGALIAQLVPAFGWRSAFLVGGIAPLLLVAVAHFHIPESAHWLILRRADHDRVRDILTSMRIALPQNATFMVPVFDNVRSISISSLLTPTYRAGTIALWCACASGAVFFSLLTSWLPIIVKDMGASTSDAIIASVVLNAGGFFGALAISWLMGRKSPYALVATGYLLGAALAIPMSQILDMPLELAGLVVFSVGLFGFGSYFSMTAMQTHFFPGHLLNVSIGCTVGFARAGGILGPMIGSFILATGGDAREMFLTSAGFAASAAAAVLIMRQVSRRVDDQPHVAARSARPLIESSKKEEVI